MFIKRYAAFSFFAIAFIMSLPGYAKDIGVCVRIIEHNESELLIKTQEETKGETQNAPDKQPADGKKNEEAGPAESKKNGTVQTLNTDEEHHTVDTDSSPHRTDAAAPTPNNENELPGPPALPEAPTATKSTAPEETAQKEKELAAARSNYEMVDSETILDPEIDNLPYGQTALVYLKRLFEHFVTHEPGYASTENQCDQTITVELYPLKRGWTAFARYSGTNREERVDQLYATELSQFAERAVLALLNDVPISTTIKRDNVLTADSKRDVQQVRGSNHFTVNIGTRMVLAKVNQVQTSGDNEGGVDREYQLYHPMKFGLGYRGRFESWGLEVQAGLGIGVGKKAASSNPEGGHIDYGGDTGLAIHFLHYKDPRGLMSFYLGGGAGFDFMWFSAINPEGSWDTRSYLYAGGLSGDGVFGWEFLRAASVQFFIQGELNLPLYVARTEHNVGSINTWMPGISFKLGVVF
ncbi:MAG: hypothetical protein JXX29_02600 [Deltaproteobacteria bacterium]|nr:hypothetical protein [Deltaproteobacteria bacterium]MBN2670531.1 hypothetical protein [Deltaproteobacteria bacterium]